MGFSAATSPVCDICGAVGYKELLAICTECWKSYEHIYCVKTMVDIIPCEWICESCHEETQNMNFNKPCWGPRSSQTKVPLQSNGDTISKNDCFQEHKKQKSCENVVSTRSLVKGHSRLNVTSEENFSFLRTSKPETFKQHKQPLITTHNTGLKKTFVANGTSASRAHPCTGLKKMFVANGTSASNGDVQLTHQANAPHSVSPTVLWCGCFNVSNGAPGISVAYEGIQAYASSSASWRVNNIVSNLPSKIEFLMTYPPKTLSQCRPTSSMVSVYFFPLIMQVWCGRAFIWGMFLSKITPELDCAEVVEMDISDDDECSNPPIPPGSPPLTPPPPLSPPDSPVDATQVSSPENLNHASRAAAGEMQFNAKEVTSTHSLESSSEDTYCSYPDASITAMKRSDDAKPLKTNKNLATNKRQEMAFTGKDLHDLLLKTLSHVQGCSSHTSKCFSSSGKFNKSKCSAAPPSDEFAQISSLQ